MGLDWPGQYSKLTSSAFYRPHVLRWAIPTEAGSRETLLLDLEYLPSWLTSISAERVHPAIKERLLAYQRECAHALHSYWTEGAAFNPRAGDTDLEALEVMSTQVSGLIQHAKQTRQIALRAEAGVEELRTVIQAKDAEAARQQTELVRLRTALDAVMEQINPTLPDGYHRWWKYRQVQRQYIPVYEHHADKTLPGPNFWGMVAELRQRMGYPLIEVPVQGQSGFKLLYDHASVYRAACERALRALWRAQAPAQQTVFATETVDLPQRRYAKMMESAPVEHPHTKQRLMVPMAEIVHCQVCQQRFWIDWLADAVCSACRTTATPASQAS
jgi:hypothetical protein